MEAFGRNHYDLFALTNYMKNFALIKFSKLKINTKFPMQAVGHLISRHFEPNTK